MRCRLRRCQVAAAGLGLLAAVLAVQGPAAAENPARPLLIAHRGASAQAPENTLTALRLAASQGADYAEIDVQRSRDQVLLLMHDATLNRTTDAAQRYPRLAPWRIADLTLAQISTLDAGLWRGPLFRGEAVPTLDEVLDALRDRIGLMIELKNPRLYPGIEAQLAARLEAAGWVRGGAAAQKLIVHSADWEALRRYHVLQPQVPIALLGEKLPSYEQLRRYDFASAVNVDQHSLSALSVAWLHGCGKRVYAYDADDLTRQRELLQMGVDGLVINQPVPPVPSEGGKPSAHPG